MFCPLDSLPLVVNFEHDQNAIDHDHFTSLTIFSFLIYAHLLTMLNVTSTHRLVAVVIVKTTSLLLPLYSTAISLRKWAWLIVRKFIVSNNFLEKWWILAR